MADALLFTYRAKTILHGIPNFESAPRAVKVRSLPSKCSESSNFACYMCYMHVASKIHATRAA